jgi:dTDP-glucose 4,6-dehydratase
LGDLPIAGDHRAPFNNFGPRQHLEKAVPRFVTSCLLDEPLRVHGDGSAARDWIYVQDTCEAIDCVAHCDKAAVVGEVINIGTGRSLSIAEVAMATVRQMGKPESLITYVGDRPGQVFRHTADSPRPSASSVGNRRSISRPGWRRPSTGIRTIAPSGTSSCGCANIQS